MRHVSTVLVALSLGLAATQAMAAPTYDVTFVSIGSSLTQSTPVWRSGSYPVGASNGTATFTGMGFSYPGHVGCFDHLDMTWTSGFSGGASAEVRCSARAEDFVITGPAGPPVSGVMHFRVQASFSRLGGFAGNGGHGSGIYVRVSANGILNTGTYRVGNSGTSQADGCLTGLSGDAIDRTFDVAGTFPVGTPFAVELMIDELGACYGNVFNANPGYVETNAGQGGGPPPTGGLRIEEVSGLVMSLPGGYTLNSASWSVVDNHFASTVSVPTATASQPLALLISPNPSRAYMSIRFSQPDAGETRLEIFDGAGRRVRHLAGGWMPAGDSVVRWDGRDAAGASVGAGLYFARLETSGRSITRRIVRLE